MRSLFISLLICISFAPIKVKADTCQADKIAYQGACWSNAGLQEHYDLNYKYNFGDETWMSDFELEELEESWADEILQDRKEN